MIAALWAAGGLLLMLSEFLVPQFVVFFFGAGALVNSLLIAIVPGLAERIPAQLILWAILSVASLVGLRRYAARWFRGDGAPRDDLDLGRTAEVVERIAPDAPGRIRFRGTTWRALSYGETIEEGTTVTILQKENLSFVVTRGDLLDDGTPQT